MKEITAKSTLSEVIHMIIDGIFFFVPGMFSLAYALLTSIHAFGYFGPSHSDILATPIMIFFIIMLLVYAIYYFTRKRDSRGHMGRISGPTPLASFGLIALVAALLILKYATSVGTNHTLGGSFFAAALLLSGAGLYSYVEALINS